MVIEAIPSSTRCETHLLISTECSIVNWHCLAFLALLLAISGPDFSNQVDLKRFNCLEEPFNQIQKHNKKHLC